MKFRIFCLLPTLVCLTSAAFGQNEFEKSLALYKAGKYSEAMPALERFVPAVEELGKEGESTAYSLYLMIALSAKEIGNNEKLADYLDRLRVVTRSIIQTRIGESQVALETKKCDEAQKILLSAIDLAVVLPEQDASYDDVRYNLALAYESCGKILLAKTTYRKSIEINRLSQDTLGFLRSAFHYATLLEETKVMDSAVLIYSHISSNPTKYMVIKGYLSMYVQASLNLSAYYESKEEYEKQVPPLEMVQLVADRGLMDSLTAAAIYNNLALAYKRTKQYLKAVPFYKRALLYREKNRPAGHIDLAQSNMNLGQLYEALDSAAIAYPYFLKAARGYLQNKATNDFNNAYEHYFMNFAITVVAIKNKGDEDGVIRAYREMLDMTRLIGWKEQTALLKKSFSGNSGSLEIWYKFWIFDLESIYTMRGRYSELEEVYEIFLDRDLTLFGKNSIQYLIRLTDIGGTYEVSGRFVPAGEKFEEALRIATAMGKKEFAYGLAAGHYGMFCMRTGQFEKAKNYLTEAIAIYRAKGKTKDPQYHTLVDNLATYLATTKDPQLASLKKELLAMPVDTTTQIGVLSHASTLQTLALAEQAAGNIKGSRAYSRQALGLITRKLGSKNDFYRHQLMSVAKDEMMDGNVEKALAMMKEGNDIDRNYINQNRVFLSEVELGQLYQGVKTNFDLYNQLVLAKFSDKPVEIGKMFSNAIFTKGLLFDNSRKIMEAIVNSGDQQLKGDFASLKQKRDSMVNVATSGTKSDKMAQEITTLEKKISLKSARFGDIYNEKPLTWQNVRSALKAGEALVEIIRVNPYHAKSDKEIHYIAIIISSESQIPKLVYLDDGVELEKKYLRYYRNTLRTHEQDTLSYRHFWKSVEAELQGVSRVFVSPDGVFNLININGLNDPATNRYVLEKYDLIVIPNSKELLSRKSATTFQVATVALFGSPDFTAATDAAVASRATSNFTIDNGKLVLANATPLPGTLEEVKTIQDLFKGKKITASVKINAEASESNVKKLQSPDVLHIATHGFFIEAPPNERASNENSVIPPKAGHPLLRSGLLLSSDKRIIPGVPTDDGILTSFEVNDLNLFNTKLVILSACETGLGEVQNGEGVYGLPRAFRAAGAKSVVMSLWKVDDTATKELMIDFYKEWTSSGNMVSALKSAQLKTRKKYPHPYYWAAFVLVGDVN